MRTVEAAESDVLSVDVVKDSLLHARPLELSEDTARIQLGLFCCDAFLTHAHNTVDNNQG